MIRDRTTRSFPRVLFPKTDDAAEGRGGEEGRWRRKMLHHRGDDMIELWHRRMLRGFCSIGKEMGGGKDGGWKQ